MKGSLPFPELVSDEVGWKVLPSEGFSEDPLSLGITVCRAPATDPMLIVPQEHSHTAQIVRNHEMAHVRWSKPGVMPRWVHPRIWQWAEDLRTALLASKVGVQTLPCPEGCRECEEVFRKLRVYATRQLRSEDAADVFINLARTALTKPIHHPNSPLKAWALRLHEVLGVALNSGGGDLQLGLNEWAEMQISTPPLTEQVWRGPRHRGKRRSSEDGETISDPTRFISDGYIFEVRQKVPDGLSILIDCSGSMQLDESVLANIVRSVPACIIGIYAGQAGDPEGGRLIIVAKDGFVAGNIKDLASRTGEANACDGPALQWLAQQPARRVWVSDGVVTNWLDQPRGVLRQEVIELCKHHSIERMKTLEEVKDLYARKPTPTGT